VTDEGNNSPGDHDNARVIWVKKDATFRDMATALREHPVSALPVSS
jgi:hypothetical protein